MTDAAVFSFNYRRAASQMYVDTCNRELRDWHNRIGVVREPWPSPVLRAMADRGMKAITDPKNWEASLRA